MSSDDFAYYEARAEAEIEFAQQATDVRAVQAHYELATAYLDRIYGDSREDRGAAGEASGS